MAEKARHRFDILPLDRFAGTHAAIKRPVEIAHFSYDENHQYRPDDSSLQYYYPPRLGANLSDGFESFRKLDESRDDHLDGLLKTIMKLEKNEGHSCQVDIVTWRGIMTKILVAPFEKFNSFDLNATLYQGTIYIEEDHESKLAEKTKDEQQRHPRTGNSQALMTYWGYKFETLSVISDTWDNVSRDEIQSRERKVVDNYSQYCSVVETGIGGVSMILGGEVDALWDCRPDDKNSPINWVELKTSEEIGAYQQQVTFERKLLKFWAQSFLLGVPIIIVGFRSRDGQLLRLEEFKTQDIPKWVKHVGQNRWDGNLCINFAAAFLKYLKATITDDGVWRIALRKGDPFIQVYKLQDKYTTPSRFLNEEFVAWRELSLAQEVADMLRSRVR